MNLRFFSSFLSFVFVFSVLGASANAFVVESYALLESDKIELQGDFSGGQFGSVIDHGDFNGDGLTDVIVGSPFASTSGHQWNGAVTVVWGASADGNSRFSLYGESPGDQLGTSLAVGDFNGDGRNNIAVGAFNALEEGLSGDKREKDKDFEVIDEIETLGDVGQHEKADDIEEYAEEDGRKGKVYILSGDSDGEIFEQDRVRKEDGEHFGDFILNKTDVVLTGDKAQGRFGISLLSEDLNGNGLDDLIVGSSEAVYVYFGREGGVRRNPDVTIKNEGGDEGFGSSLAAGDFCGNGEKDLAIGAYKADVDDRSDVGKVYVYKNVANRGSLIDSPDSYLTGFYTGSWFGFDIDTGDVNGDGTSDLLVSSFPYNKGYRSSGIYLYYGGDGFANSIVPDVIVDDSHQEVLPGADVLLKDLNGNDKDDIIIGAPSIRHIGGSDSGRIYIIFTDEEEDLRRHYPLRGGNGINIIYGESDYDWFGYGLNAFDNNDNSLNDLAVGARYSYSSAGIRTGKLFIFEGGDRPFGEARSLSQGSGSAVSRGEFLKMVIENFELRERRADFLESCYDHKEFCLFNFMAMSSFNDISLEPELVLYPDVPTDHPFSSYINDATVLDLVNGYLGAENSPFLPDAPITRIQALKVILGAAGLVENMYKFELVDELGGHSQLLSQYSPFPDIDPEVDSMWWMPRYINFAVQSGIVRDSDYFYPHEEVTVEVLNKWIAKTLALINSADKTENEETQS